MIPLDVGSTLAGRYRLERALARGGMGSIWVARHLQLDVDVAIKFMAPEHAASPEARARFEREAKASALLRIPNVVHVYDYGIEGGTPYLVMELLEGEDLDARLRREGRLPLDVAAGLVLQVCKALRRAHETGLVHRDLKPGNLFLARQGDEEVVKVLDFGIVKASGLGVAGAATKTGTLIGSPYYMSPEQVRRRKDVDHRSDLWSLGVIIFQCLTGRLPFASEELGDVLVEICADEIPVASQIAPDLGPEVDAFLSRALMRDPEQRFQSASELAEAFAALAGSTGRGALDRQPSSPFDVQPGRRSTDAFPAGLASPGASMLPSAQAVLPSPASTIPGEGPPPIAAGSIARTMPDAAAASSALLTPNAAAASSAALAPNAAAATSAPPAPFMPPPFTPAPVNRTLHPVQPAGGGRGVAIVVAVVAGLLTLGLVVSLFVVFREPAAGDTSSATSAPASPAAAPAEPAPSVGAPGLSPAPAEPATAASGAPAELADAAPEASALAAPPDAPAVESARAAAGPHASGAPSSRAPGVPSSRARAAEQRTPARAPADAKPPEKIDDPLDHIE